MEIIPGFEFDSKTFQPIMYALDDIKNKLVLKNKEVLLLLSNTVMGHHKLGIEDFPTFRKQFINPILHSIKGKYGRKYVVETLPSEIFSHWCNSTVRDCKMKPRQQELSILVGDHSTPKFLINQYVYSCDICDTLFVDNQLYKELLPALVCINPELLREYSNDLKFMVAHKDIHVRDFYKGYFGKEYQDLLKEIGEQKGTDIVDLSIKIRKALKVPETGRIPNGISDLLRELSNKRNNYFDEIIGKLSHLKLLLKRIDSTEDKHKEIQLQLKKALKKELSIRKKAKEVEEELKEFLKTDFGLESIEPLLQGTYTFEPLYIKGILQLEPRLCTNPRCTNYSHEITEPCQECTYSDPEKDAPEINEDIDNEIVSLIKSLLEK